MSARDRLIQAIPAWLALDDAVRLVDDYAHELAEKIRQDTTATGEAGDQYALLYAALIDPFLEKRRTEAMLNSGDPRQWLKDGPTTP